MGKNHLASLVITALLVACGGGGSGSSTGGNNPAPSPPPPDPLNLVEAARFSSQATFGLNYEEIESLAKMGREAWLQQQFSLPVGWHTTTVDELIVRREAGEFEAYEDDVELLAQFRRLAWWNCAVTCGDVLRQRVAFALSEILVVSDKVDTLIVFPYALSTYYDMLLEHSFGNYKDLLHEAALHPAMGIYLSHLNNRKSDPFANTFPDENFAREIMQLFSIGLFELNIDGSSRVDGSGNPIATYNNADIREFAKVFTGLSWGGPSAFFGRDLPYFRAPMKMFDEFHEQGSKELLGTSLSAGQTGEEDFDAAIDVLFNHANVGPFIGKQLIQRLVTSNPSPSYIQRVATIFNDDGNGVRGNLQAVIQQIFTDPEAIAAPDPSSEFGKLREPAVRFLNMLRKFGATSDDGFIANSGYLIQELGRQHPLSSPSVFNFFLPAHSPPGEIAAAGLVAPEFEIVNSGTIVNMLNLLDYSLFGDSATDSPEPFGKVRLELGALESLANDVDALIDNLDIVLTNGGASEETREVIRGVLIDLDSNPLRVKLGIYMFMMSADYVIRI